MTESRSLLIILAHPDDESFAMGGTIAKYAAEGVPVTLITATRGEAGKCGDPPLCAQEDLGAFREGELRKACQVLGVKELIFLDYRDKEVAQAPREEILGKLVRQIRRLRPEVVVTFGPDGISRHPDHIAISGFATEAFHLAADPAAFPGEGEPWQARTLFYLGMPKSVSQAFGMGHVAAREDGDIAAAIPVGPYLETKRQAIFCHQTQIFSIRKLARLSDPENADPRQMRLREMEYFFRAYPVRQPGEPAGDDLFA